MARILSKDELIEKLKDISKQGWIENARPGNGGGVGNTIEDLLGIEENNLPIANAAEWELKCQRSNSSSLTTLLHMEPSLRALKFVPSIFLLKYGWPHELAGKKHPKAEMSFRQTIHGGTRSDRGFMVKIDRGLRKVLISFDSKFEYLLLREFLKEVLGKPLVSQNNVFRQCPVVLPWRMFNLLSLARGIFLISFSIFSPLLDKIPVAKSVATNTPDYTPKK